ncbi:MULTISPECIES: aromatic ring-hydroxylating oxygenase subunit alpha [unclassified Cupriavidus]|uniref:aromatic ring-hydroxylating oxygenase subunit alpha n=1 Tax=Cupriavidus sp. H19C3 TaxID=3241603 RepID=UPI0011D949C3|nr:MAG: aromatic ring-hydroxylating dioxygenase subunit alpha [Cupriavidus sp.]
MSDLSLSSHFEAEQLQLPVASYCDEEVFALEQERIFAQSSVYVGHEKMVPDPGDWRALGHEDNARVLVRNANGVELISNVCRHRQALMLGDFGVSAVPSAARGGACSGNLRQRGGNIVCPLHGWTYDNGGQLVGAPQFAQPPCRNLRRFPLHHAGGGFLFEGPRDPLQDLRGLFDRPEFEFGDYVLDHVEMHRCDCNWKTFVEIYNDDYHIGPFHPGLGRYVHSDGLDWEYGDWYSVQRIDVHPTLEIAGTDTYRAWHDRLLAHNGGKVPAFGAIWATYYPTHMIEVFPYALVLSTVYPKGVHETMNVIEFYYPEELAAFDRELVEAHRAAYMETAVEDDEIAERVDAGRRALYRRGESDTGPYQSPLEDGMRHFHGWYRTMMSQPTSHQGGAATGPR